MSIYFVDITLKHLQDNERKEILENELAEKINYLQETISDHRKFEETLKLSTKSFFATYNTILKYITFNKDGNFFFLVDDHNLYTDIATSPNTLKARLNINKPLLG